MRTPSSPLVVLVSCLLLSGCYSHHYVVDQEETPLYAGPRDDTVLATLPLYHHEALPNQVVKHSGRVRVPYRGRVGWAPRSNLVLLRYTDPSLDGGEDQGEKIRRTLRHVQVKHVGQEWPREIRRKVKRGIISIGMTRRQVETAWGWPINVEPGEVSGEERWIYRTDSYKLVHRFVDDPWYYSPYSQWGHLPSSHLWNYQSHTRWRDYGGWVEVKVPVKEERVVTIDKNGRVRQVKVRKYLS